MTGNKYQKAFTVAELLVVISMIGILSLIVIPSYKNAKDQLALERSVVGLAQYIRKAQEMAMSSEETGGTVPEGGYGIFLKKVLASEINNSYILFADNDNDHKCDGCNSDSEEFIERIFFEGGIKIKNLDNPHINVIFKPPDPEIYLTDNDGNNLAGFQTAIEICLINDETKTKIIRVNKVGLISID